MGGGYLIINTLPPPPPSNLSNEKVKIYTGYTVRLEFLFACHPGPGSAQPPELPGENDVFEEKPERKRTLSGSSGNYSISINTCIF